MATYLDSYLNSFTSNANSNNIEDEVLKMFVERKRDVRELIKNRWLLGKRPDGNIIGTYRDIEYQSIKQNMNPKAGGNVDLIFSQSLVNQIDMLLTTTGIQIISRDSKYDKIVKKYGSDNFNITKEEEDEIIGQIMIEITNNLFKKIW